MKQEAVDMLEKIRDEVMTPFRGMVGMANIFVERYGKFFHLVKSIKDAYDVLKEG